MSTTFNTTETLKTETLMERTYPFPNKTKLSEYKNAVRTATIMGVSVVVNSMDPMWKLALDRDRYIIEFMSQVRGWHVRWGADKYCYNRCIWDLIEVKTDHSDIYISGKLAHNMLFDESEDIPHLSSEDVSISNIDGNWTIRLIGGPSQLRLSDSCTEPVWYVCAKLVLTVEDMYKVATLAFDSNIPFGKTIQLQADAHIAGSYTWIGMIASYDDVAIPFVTVSADIGCGLSILPLVTVGSVDGKHLKTTDFKTKESLDKFKTKFMINARRALFRGKKSDNGDTSNVIALFNEALMFFGSQICMSEFVSELDYIFKTLDIDTKGSDSLTFASRFLQSLGSSGNHFIELAESSADNTLYTVTHSGSRGLGAQIYKQISIIAHIYAGNNIASGNLAQIYRRAFDVLCKFAQINRILCGLAVLKKMDGFVIDGDKLKHTMIHSPMFDGPNPLSDAQRTKLLFGLTHNGIKTFVNHQDKQIIHVMSKGAVALSRNSDIGIIALRAGDGCDLFILNNPDAKWVEIQNHESVTLPDYTQVFELESTDLCFAGHGAGRSGSATSTSKKSSYSMMMEYYNKVGFIGNIAPGVLGDNPEIAYKGSAEIRAKLPIDSAVFHTNLKTLVNHKEGINYRWNRLFTKFCVDTYHTMDDNSKLWLDIGLVRNDKGMSVLFADQQTRIEEFLTCYDCK
jgi:hypothetical protein